MARTSGVGNVIKYWNKLSDWSKIFTIALVALLAVIIVNAVRGNREGFETSAEFITKRGQDVYDDFYATLYDDLVFSDLKNQWEIGQIINKTNPSSASYILDIGSGTGHHVGALKGMGFKAAGIDISPSMVQQANKNYPDGKFQVGDVNKTMTFGPDLFTHILCLYFTIYYIKNKRQFFKNCMYWLAPGGYLALHLVDRAKFDPILPVADGRLGVDPQDYAKERITKSQAEFENYVYTAEFDLKKDVGKFNEIFQDRDTGAVRKNELTLYMPTQSEILAMARDAGFILVAQMSMAKCFYKNQFLYILQKPN